MLKLRKCIYYYTKENFLEDETRDILSAIIFIRFVEEASSLDPLNVHVEEQLVWRVVVRVGVHVHVWRVVSRRWGPAWTHHGFIIVLVGNVEQIGEGQGLASHSVEVGVAHGTLVDAV